MRTLLFVPGDNPSMLQNSPVFESDLIIIDLEDAVSIDNKDAARNLVKEFLNICNYKDRIVVRINSLDSEYYHKDLEMLSDFDIFAIMLPKATESVITEFNKLYTSKLIPIVESCIAVTEIEKLVKFNNVCAILLGAEDLACDLEVERSEDSIEILYPRQLLSYYCKAYNKIAIDTPCTNASNMEVVRRDAKFAKKIGLKAKACIHPNQVPIINEVFSVTKKEFVEALRVLKAVEMNKGKGAFSLDGKMVDEPIIKRARRHVEQGLLLGMEDSYE